MRQNVHFEGKKIIGGHAAANIRSCAFVCTSNYIRYTTPNCAKVTYLEMTVINVNHVDDKIKT
jgi:hypothetical protein